MTDKHAAYVLAMTGNRDVTVIQVIRRFNPDSNQPGAVYVVKQGESPDGGAGWCAWRRFEDMRLSMRGGPFKTQVAALDWVAYLYEEDPSL